MQKKLTLSIEEDLVKFAHDFSLKTRQTISNIVAQYFERLKAQSESSTLSDKTLNLYGAFADEPIPSKKELRNYFHEKSDH